MRRSASALAILPFALVFVLAAALGIAGFYATPRAATSVASSALPTVTPRASARPPSASPGTTRSDAEEMLRVHNGLRLAIGAPVLRGDPRVTAAAQRHAEYLAQNGTLAMTNPRAPRASAGPVSEIGSRRRVTRTRPRAK